MSLTRTSDDSLVILTRIRCQEKVPEYVKLKTVFVVLIIIIPYRGSNITFSLDVL